MTERSRRAVPADMLLVEERRRRILGSPSPIVATDDDQLISDEDQLIEIESADQSISAASSAGDLLLRRPMAQVSLAQVSWSGPIDHRALMDAMLCYPTDSDAPLIDRNVFDMPTLSTAPAGAALEVTLHGDDVAVLRDLRSSGAHGQAEHILRAACLPERLMSAEPGTRHAASAFFADYRHAALAYAWHCHLSRTESVQLHRERDETAVIVLSTLRALLGER